MAMLQPWNFLHDFVRSRGGSRGEGVDWVATHPALWGRLSLKLRKGTKLSLRQIMSLIVPISFCQVIHHLSKILDPPMRCLHDCRSLTKRPCITHVTLLILLSSNISFSPRRSHRRTISLSLHKKKYFPGFFLTFWYLFVTREEK